MHSYAQVFAAFCERNFALNANDNDSYQSLPLCIIDCVFSLRAVYKTMTLPVVSRYAEAYLNGDAQNKHDAVSLLIRRIDDCGGPLPFASSMLRNRQKTGGVLKAEVCYQLAKQLLALGIETLDDFRRFPYPDLLETTIHSVQGMGDAGTNYLFMLAGDPNRCKPDVHIHHCIQDACGEDISNEACQRLFADAVNILKDQYPRLTVRSLDGAIWRVYSARQRGKPLSFL